MVVDVLRTVDVERVDVVDGRDVEVDVEVGRAVVVVVVAVLRVDTLVGRAGNAVVVVLRRCVLTDVDFEVEVPRDVDTDVVRSEARRTCIGVVAVARVVVETLVAMRAVLFTRRRSFSLPRL